MHNYNRPLATLLLMLFLAYPVYADFSKDSFVTDVIGQTYNLSEIPTFEQLGKNNGPNSYGIDQASSIAIDTEGHRLFVADTNNDRVLVFELSDQNTFDDYEAKYVLGQENLYSSNYRVAGAIVGRPFGLAFDQLNQRLFVSSLTQHKIIVFDVSEIQNGEQSIASFGEYTYGSASANTLNQPQSLAYDQAKDYLYVSDANNGRVLIFDVSSLNDDMSAMSVLGKPDFSYHEYNDPPTQSDIALPFGLELDTDRGYLFVVDNENRRILIYDVNEISNGEDPIHVLGQADFESKSPSEELDGLNNVHDIAYHPIQKKLFATDIQPDLTSRILVFDLADIVNGEAAESVFGSGSSLDAYVESPSFLTIDKETDLLYVVDSNFIAISRNDRIVTFDISTVSETERAVGVLGQVTDIIDPEPTFSKIGPNNGAKSNGLHEPQSVAIDSDGHRLFVADYRNHRVLVYNLDDNNNITDNHADYVLGQKDFNGALPLTTASRMNRPYALEFDSTNKRLFVADYDNGRVLVFDVAEITNGEDAIGVLGQPNFSTNSVATTSSGMNSPAGLAYDDSRQYLYVSDSGEGGGNNRILVFDTKSITNGEDAMQVLGQSDFTTSTFGTSQSKFSAPSGLSLDQENKRLFMSDQNNSRILVFDVNTITNGENAIAVLGADDFTSRGTSSNFADVSAPRGLEYEPESKRLFVAGSLVYVFDVEEISNGEDWLFYLGSSKDTPDNRIPSAALDLAYDSLAEKLWIANEFNRVLVVNSDPSYVPSKESITSFLKKIGSIRTKNGTIDSVLLLELTELMNNFKIAASNQFNSKKQQKKSKKASKQLQRFLKTLNSFNSTETKKKQKKFARKIKRLKKTIRKSLKKLKKI